MTFRFVAGLAAVIALGACGGPSGPAPETASPATGAPAEVATPAPAPARAMPTLALADLPAPYNAADLAAGEAAFIQCSACHQLDPALGNTVGPNLHGVFARAPGGLAEYRYSDALKAHAAAVPQWTPADLEKWLADPTGYLPGTAMFFNGIADPATRTNLIAYLLIRSS
jgi:cytochrome c